MSGPSHKRPIKITPELLERCLDRVALAIDREGAHGAVYLPIFERLEAELAAMRRQEAALDRVRQRLKR